MDIGSLYSSRILDYHAELGVKTGIPLGNMSFCRLNDGNYLVSVRQFNYSLDPVTAKGRLFDGFFDSRAYHMMIVNPKFYFLKKVHCEGLEMVEDVRLVRYGNIIQVSGTDISYGQKDYKIVCLDFKMDEAVDHMTLVDKKTFPIPHEKNYMPIEDEKGIFVSDMLPNEIHITSTADLPRKTSHECRGLIKYSGSSQLFRYRDGYVALVHRREKRKYVNAFAFFDKRLIQCRISDEFSVFADVSPVNFICGMALDGEKAILTPCVHDKMSHLFELPLPDFSMTAHWRT